MLTKKEGIWLGVRVIGFFYLLQLFSVLIDLGWFVVCWLWKVITRTQEGGFTVSFLTRLTALPYTLFLTVYFLFFGTFVYKLVDRCSRSRPQNPTMPAGYDPCEIIIRFCGVWLFFMAISRICAIALTFLNQLIYIAFTPSRPGQTSDLAAVFRHFFNIDVIISLLLYLGLGFLFVWYFLKKGKFFIRLLYRLWMKKIGQSPAVQRGL